MSDVYFLPWKDREKIQLLLEAAGLKESIPANSFTAIKMHFGERTGKGYIKPELVKPIVEEIKKLNGKPFLTDANTIYIGARSNAVSHLELAANHGFTVESVSCPVIIADGLRGDSWEEVEICLKHFKRVKISSAVYYADTVISLAHFKGHCEAGFGGTLKNLGMGAGSRAGKYQMHSGIVPEVQIEKCTGCGKCIRVCVGNALTLADKKIHLDRKKCVGCGECVVVCKNNTFRLTWGESMRNLQERIVEYAYGAVKDKPSLFLNYINHVTKNCDCMGKDEEPLIPDIGILASKDPIAIEQASMDLINEKAGYDVFRKVWPETDWNIQLEYGEKIGMGSRKYKLSAIKS